MVKIEKNISVTQCDVCGNEQHTYRICSICKKDVCQNCVVELYKKKTYQIKKCREYGTYGTNYTFGVPFISEEQHQYIDSMCKCCYELFKKVVEKRITI